MLGKVIFVSGIDTDVGKTIATGFYAKTLQEQGFSVITQKMIQTGGEGIAADILVHRKIQGIDLLPEDKAGLTCPYVFPYPCSPHLAARLAHTEIDENKITNAVNQLRQKYDYVLLEGAGGLAVPYTETRTTLDYLKTQQYSLILVSSGKLGSINHTLLSLMTCQQYQIPLEALVYNRYLDQDSLISQNTEIYLLNYLQQHFPKAKFIGLDKIDI
ncbi:dethiobiotin synthase [Glaesserella parasuis]|uniref:ATP-dependent dethiobiotin synthetase BioD n=2 Tax=Glaesserella parasuis TaxID=738 RepID=A0A1T0A7N0_GLAPU|nr:dethiobiotin synthase [Glaesserella parasuis]AGO17191.1 dithiobiotin synthetase [Glaesserella parasuis ZJ0906]ATW44543.1 dethiobiotin synthase [Glaesserella parasuis str. Nagasaki]AWY44589.1 dethiobiotin synthase [Glaesserella parasuis 29755]EQA00293.1 dethiobiotin synthase [Glaesserella parasuis str. Nagasaki]EYE71393.1 dithiobiotin synthetase [Glaesserella parasuis str. Nagasaki]